MKPATTGERIADTVARALRDWASTDAIGQKLVYDLGNDIDAAIAAEREACAEVAREYGAGWFDSRTFAAQEIAAAIRARGNT